MTKSYFTTAQSPIGELFLTAAQEVLTGLFALPDKRTARLVSELERDPGPFAGVCEQLEQYWAGDRTRFEVEIAPHGSPFQVRVWKALETIPYGHTVSYRELARRTGNDAGARAVGMANARNPISIIVPCHRVIGSRGDLVGYAGGLERKRLLLELEANVMGRAVRA
jgi:methylated-DNA-[protein]-cysteine S-methyltransferase